MIHNAALSVKSDPRNPLAPAARLRLLAWLLFAFTSLALAEKAAESSDDFLEYLGSMENDDDNWSDFAQQHNAQDNKAAAHSHQSSSANSEQSSDPASNHSTSARSVK